MSKIIIAPIIFSSLSLWIHRNLLKKIWTRCQKNTRCKKRREEEEKMNVGEERRIVSKEATATNCKEMENNIIMIDRLSCADRNRVVNMYSYTVPVVPRKAENEVIYSRIMNCDRLFLPTMEKLEREKKPNTFKHAWRLFFAYLCCFSRRFWMMSLFLRHCKLRIWDAHQITRIFYWQLNTHFWMIAVSLLKCICTSMCVRASCRMFCCVFRVIDWFTENDRHPVCMLCMIECLEMKTIRNSIEICLSVILPTEWYLPKLISNNWIMVCG